MYKRNFVVIGNIIKISLLFHQIEYPGFPLIFSRNGHSIVLEWMKSVCQTRIIYPKPQKQTSLLYQYSLFYLLVLREMFCYYITVLNILQHYLLCYSELTLFNISSTISLIKSYSRIRRMR